MKKRKYHLYQVFIIFAVALILITFFGSEELSAWAKNRKNPMVRKIASPLTALHQFNSENGWATPANNLNKSFVALKDFTFKKVEEPVIEPEPVIDTELALVEDEDEDKLLVPGKISVLLAGDSLVVATNFSFTPIANQYDDLIFRVEGVVGANLVNPDMFDWTERSATIAAEEDWDIVLIMLGANAVQPGFFNGHTLYFNSEEWVEVYKDRATRMVNNFKNDGAEVWWIALPPMQKDDYKEGILTVNGIIGEVCEETGAKMVSIDEIFGDENGLYTKYKVINGKQVSLRTDGIHYTFAGARLLTEFLIDKIRKNFSFQSAELIEATRIQKEQELQRFKQIYSRE